jgi:enoyl-CoA hydratase
MYMEWSGCAEDFCRHSVVDGVYTIELCRFAQRNALTPEMYRSIRSGVLRAQGIDEVDVVVLVGGDGVFAVGGDLKIFRALLELDADRYRIEFARAFDEPLPFRAILDCPKPVIAAVDGLCMAGGLLLASAADIVLATDRAVFAIPEGRVGLADGLASALLAPTLGLSHTRYILLTGRSIDAETAERWGLVSEVVAPDDLTAAVAALVADLRSCSPEAKATYKRLITTLMPPLSSTLIAELANGANGREGLAAFAEKRPPQWVPSHGSPV